MRAKYQADEMQAVQEAPEINPVSRILAEQNRGLVTDREKSFSKPIQINTDELLPQTARAATTRPIEFSVNL
jgi:hypothetical protein